MPPRCLHHRIVAEDERPGVIGFDQPFGERLITHLVEASEHDDDIRERVFAEVGKPSECFQP